MTHIVRQHVVKTCTVERLKQSRLHGLLDTMETLNVFVREPGEGRTDIFEVTLLLSLELRAAVVVINHVCVSVHGRRVTLTLSLEWV